MVGWNVESELEGSQYEFTGVLSWALLPNLVKRVQLLSGQTR